MKSYHNPIVDIMRFEADDITTLFVISADGWQGFEQRINHAIGTKTSSDPIDQRFDHNS